MIDSNAFRAFAKYAGTGIDIHGYYEDPDRVRKRVEQAEKEWDRKHGPALKEWKRKNPPPEAPKPGFLRRLVGMGPSEQAQEEYRKAWKARRGAQPVPDPPDPYDELRAARATTPFDRDSGIGYKLHAMVLGADNWKNDPTTDEVYGPKPVRRNLSKKRLQKLLSDYEGRLPEVARSDGELQAGKAFLQKGRHLLKDPKVKTVRVEWE